MDCKKIMKYVDNCVYMLYICIYTDVQFGISNGIFIGTIIKNSKKYQEEFA